MFDDLLDKLNNIAPGINISKKAELDFELDKYILTMKHLIKYLNETDESKMQFENTLVRRSEWFKEIVETNNQVFFYKTFRVFSDKSIEIPQDFKDEDFDEFLYCVGERGIYDFGI